MRISKKYPKEVHRQDYWKPRAFQIHSIYSPAFLRTLSAMSVFGCNFLSTELKFKRHCVSLTLFRRFLPVSPPITAILIAKLFIGFFNDFHQKNVNFGLVFRRTQDRSEIENLTRLFAITYSSKTYLERQIVR